MVADAAQSSTQRQRNFKRNRSSGISLTALFSYLVTMMALIGYTEAQCGSQDWHCGWLAFNQVTYQVMRTSAIESAFVVGGKTTAPGNFHSGTQTLYSASDSQAAIVSVFNINTKFPLYTFVVSEWSAHSTAVQGVRDISLQSDNYQRLIVLFETDQDSTHLLFGWYKYVNSVTHLISLTRVTILSSISQLHSYQVDYYGDNKIWFAGDSSDSSGKRYPVSLELRILNDQIAQDQWSKMHSELDDHVFVALQHTQNYAFRVTQGTCRISGIQTADSILVSFIDNAAHSDGISLIGNNQLCYAGTQFGTKLEPISIMAWETSLEWVVTAQAGPDEGFMTIARDSSTNNNFRRLCKMSSGQGSYVASVTRRDTCCKIDLVLVNRSDSDILYVLKGYDVLDGTQVAYEALYSVPMTSQASSTEFTLHEKSSYLSMMINKGSTFIVMGQDFTMQFPIAAHDPSDSTITSQCLAAGFTSSTDLVAPKSSTAAGDTQTQSSTGLIEVVDSFSELWQVKLSTESEFVPSISVSHYVQNTCQLQVRNLFSNTYHNVGTLGDSSEDPPIEPNPNNNDTQMNLGSWASDQCPDGTNPGESYSDLSIEYSQIVRISNDSSNPSWPSTMFSNEGTTEVLKISASAYPSMSLTTYQFYYRVGYPGMTSNELNHQTLQSCIITLMSGSPCEITDAPTKSSDSTYLDNYTFVYGRSMSPIKVSLYRMEECADVRTLTMSSGAALDTSIYTFSQYSTYDSLVFAGDDPLGYGELRETSETLRYTVYNVQQTSSQSIVFSVTFRMSTCNKSFEIPDMPYPFYNSTYIIADPPMTIDLTDVYLNDCPYSLSVMDNSDVGQGPKELNPDIFTLVQPQTVTNPSDFMKVSVTEYGKLEVFTEDLEYVFKNFTIQLTIHAERFAGEQDSQTIEFFVTFDPCVSVHEDKTIYYDPITYVHEDPMMFVGIVSVANTTCINSNFEIQNGLSLPDAFIVTNHTEARGLELNVFTTEDTMITGGNKTVVLMEVDWFSGYKTKHQFSVNIFMPDPDNPFLGYIERDEPEQEIIIEEETEEVEEEEPEPVLWEPPFTIGPDGQIIYPWQKGKTAEERQQVFDEKQKVIIPLKAYAEGISPTGNLTINFNKPIIVPPIRVDSVTVVPEKATNVTTRMLDSENKYEFDIQDVIELYVESGFYESDSPEIGIKDYNLTRLTERQFDLQVQFQEPSKLTKIVSEPDGLKIRFIKAEMFMDSQDFTQLEAELSFETAIQPQMTAAEVETLETVSESVASSMAGASIGLIILQIFLAIGLKYLWNIMNLLQFLIFMQMWVISLPPTTRIVLKELKNLALLEFIPTEVFTDFLKKIIGTDDGADLQSSCSNDSCESGKEEKSSVSEESGIDRLGSSSLIDNMGSMLVIGMIILAILLLLLLLWCIAKRSPKIKKCYNAIKKKLFFNTFLRYVLQSTLKLQVAACTVLAYDKMTTKEVLQETTQMQKSVSMVILAVLNTCPFLFFLIVWRNQSNLDKAEIKAKIGTLYNGLNAKRRSVKTSAFAFLARRSIFVVITFNLFDQPGMQVHFMIFLTMIYIIYLGYQDYYESSGSKTLEITNESVFVLIQYCFVLLHNLVWDELTRETIGNLIIGLTAFLLALNMVVIVIVSVKAICRACYLRKLKRKAMKAHLEALKNRRDPPMKLRLVPVKCVSASLSASLSAAQDSSSSLALEDLSIGEIQQRMESYGLTPIGIIPQKKPKTESSSSVVVSSECEIDSPSYESKELQPPSSLSISSFMNSSQSSESLLSKSSLVDKVDVPPTQTIPVWKQIEEGTFKAALSQKTSDLKVQKEEPELPQVDLVDARHKIAEQQRLVRKQLFGFSLDQHLDRPLHRF